MIEVGRVCLKNTGREAGKYCVVLKKVNESFVSVTGPRLLTGVKRRRCNVDHLNSTEYKVEIKEDSNDEEIMAAMEKQSLITKLKLKRPSAAEMKTEATKQPKKGAEKTSSETAETKEKKESKKEESKK